MTAPDSLPLKLHEKTTPVWVRGFVNLLDQAGVSFRRNVMLTSIYLFNYHDVLKMKKPVCYYTEEQVDEAKSKPAIFHATTCFYVKKRMWVENSDHPYAKFYKDYRSRTLWKNDPQVKDSRTKSKRIYAQFWHCMPKACAVTLASWVINYFRPFYAWVTTKASITTIAEQSTT